MNIKILVKYTMFLAVIVFMLFSCVDRYYGKPLYIRNNTDQPVFYWYAHWIYDRNHTNYHYPDTILPSRIPTIRAVPPNRAVDACRVSRIPNWERIFSELPAGKFSIYFFTEYPETQEKWDLIRENYDLYRIDVTYQEFVNNDYVIDFPSARSRQ